MNHFIDVNNYKVVSFDIFDTLLLRTVAKPVDVFASVWVRAQNLGIAGSDLSKDEFVKLRVEMERLARTKAKNRECTLYDIYEQFPGFITSDSEQLSRIEVETECDLCYLNRDVYQIALDAKESGAKIVLVSDMYLSGKDLMQIMSKNGFDIGLIDTILVSNEHKRNKQDGELFRILLDNYPDILPSEILHIGDNSNSDVLQAQKMGLCTYHYNAIPDQPHNIYEYEKIRHNIPVPELLSLRKICFYNKDKQGFLQVETQAYEIGATIVGPFLTMFISHVMKRMKELGIKRIYPLMREGYILGKLLEKEAEDQNYEIEIHPIYISRKVTYIPSICRVNREEIENMIGARNLTVKESIELVGLDVSDIDVEDNYLNCIWKETHTITIHENISLKEYLIQEFLKEKNKKKIKEFVSFQRKLLTDYLIQEIGDLKGVATIDIGFFGRIQMWMEDALEIEGIPHEMKHFLGIGVTGDKVFRGYDFEGYYSTYGENSDLIPTIHRTTDILEKFISVTEGSTVGYQRLQDGTIIPVKGESVNNNSITEKSFEGILDFQKIYHDFRRCKQEQANSIEKNRRGLLQIMHRLIDMPRLCEAKLISGIEADTNFGTNYKKAIITKENLELMEEKGVDYIDKCNASYTYDNSCIVWPKGLVTLKDEFYYVRRAMENATTNEILKSMQQVVKQVKEQGIESVALYGAGENGRQFYLMCQLYGLKVDCFVDRKESLWGTQKEGITIMGLEEAKEKGYDNYIITSLFSIGEIKTTIEEKYHIIDRKPRVFCV